MSGTLMQAGFILPVAGYKGTLVQSIVHALVQRKVTLFTAIQYFSKCAIQDSITLAEILLKNPVRQKAYNIILSQTDEIWLSCKSLKSAECLVNDRTCFQSQL